MRFLLSRADFSDWASLAGDTSFSNRRPAPVGYTNDAAGNLTTAVLQTIEWDAAQRIRYFKAGARWTEFTYVNEDAEVVLGHFR